jgi:hypothetical protein
MGLSAIGYRYRLRLLLMRRCLSLLVRWRCTGTSRRRRCRCCRPTASPPSDARAPPSSRSGTRHRWGRCLLPSQLYGSPSPRWMHSSCTRHQVTCCSSLAVDLSSIRRGWGWAKGILSKPPVHPQELKESLKLGRPLSSVEAHAVRRAHPPTRNIGCPYGAWYCDTYW